jgi:hypothetical protein
MPAGISSTSAGIPSVPPDAVRRAMRDRAEMGLLGVRPAGRLASSC